MGLEIRLLALLSLACCAAASMYCGDENCYDVLQIAEKATDNEIKKAYRKLSLEVHPDKNKSPDAPAKFQRVATAYEILIDAESRRDFDYALAHPEERMYNQYRYYRQQYKKTVQADVRLVVGGALVIFSALQYAARITSYNSVMKAIKATPRYQHRLKQLKAEAEAAAAAADVTGKGGKKGGGKGTSNKGKKGPGGASAAIDEKELEKLIDVNVHGGYSKPKVEEILLVWLVLLPLQLGRHVLRQGEWVYKYRVLKQPYDHEAQLLLTCQKLELTREVWDSQPEKTRDRLLQQQLWIPENYTRFLREWKNSK